MEYDLSELNNVQRDWCIRYLSGQSMAAIKLDTGGDTGMIKKTLDRVGIQIRPDTILRGRRKA